MSDARERLRRYLEQRRELGESEFVLDSLSVEDALKVLAFGATPPAGAAPPAARAGAPAPGRVDSPMERPTPPVADSAKRRAAEEAAKGGDWREALRAVDAAEAAKPAGAERPGPAAKATPKPAAKAASTPAGGESLTVGGGSAGSGLDHLRTLDDVAKAIAGCTACDLYATARNPVPGEGIEDGGPHVAADHPLGFVLVDPEARIVCDRRGV